MICVNSENVRHLLMPFGGGKKSSGVGRNDSFGLYMETKNIPVALDNRRGVSVKFRFVARVSHGNSSQE